MLGSLQLGLLGKNIYKAGFCKDVLLTTFKDYPQLTVLLGASVAALVSAKLINYYKIFKSYESSTLLVENLGNNEKEDESSDKIIASITLSPFSYGELNVQNTGLYKYKFLNQALGQVIRKGSTTAVLVTENINEHALVLQQFHNAGAYTITKPTAESLNTLEEILNKASEENIPALIIIDIGNEPVAPYYDTLLRRTDFWKYTEDDPRVLVIGYQSLGKNLYDDITYQESVIRNKAQHIITTMPCLREFITETLSEKVAVMTDEDRSITVSVKQALEDKESKDNFIKQLIYIAHLLVLDKSVLRKIIRLTFEQANAFSNTSKWWPTMLKSLRIVVKSLYNNLVDSQEMKLLGEFFKLDAKNVSFSSLSLSKNR